MALTDSFVNPIRLSPPSALASFEESLQVATSPCCRRDLPDVISVNPSLGAEAPVTAVLRSACACFFLRVIGLPPFTIEVGFPASPRPNDFLTDPFFETAAIPLCSGPQVCSPPRSFLPLRLTSQGSRGFYIRAEHASFPPHASDILTIRFRQLMVWGLTPHEIHSLVGCSSEIGIFRQSTAFGKDKGYNLHF